MPRAARASGHVPGRDREDSISEIARRHGRGVDAGAEFPMESPWGQKLERPNYWGYDPLAFFAPHRGYAAGSEPGCQVNEFKEMVQALHAAGIEVILDVVFNHTAEGNELGPTLSFKGLENRVYYMLGQRRQFLPQLHRLRQHDQRQSSDRPRNVLPLPAALGAQLPHRRLPLRSGVDPQPQPQRRNHSQSAGGRVDCRRPAACPTPRSLPRRGTPPGRTKLARSAICAGPNGTGVTATTCGSFGAAIRTCSAIWPRGWPARADLYQAGGRQPYHSINFVTSHDGFTLNDLVSYSYKHNEDNGEGNRDGDNNNHSDNYGVEGPTRKKNIEVDSPAANQELHGHASAEPGRADAAGRRRMPPHAARQQQRLLPRQPDFLVRLDAG